MTFSLVENFMLEIVEVWQLLDYYWVNIKIAVIKSSIERKYSIYLFTLFVFTKFLIDDPKAAHGDIEIGHITKAVEAIIKTEVTKFPSFGRNPDTAILEIVQAFGFTIWNNAAS